MRNLTTIVTTCWPANMVLCGNDPAQQTAATNTQRPPTAKAAPAPATGAQKAPTAKAGTAASPRTPAPLTLKTQKDKASYAVGLNVGKNLEAQLTQQSVEVNQAILLRGVKDALAGGKTLLTDDEVKAVLTHRQADAPLKQLQKIKAATDLNTKEGR